VRRAGTVVGTAQGVAVVRCHGDSYPDVGTDLVDEQLDQVGAVVDVFGPVERPYLAVSPADRQVVTLVGDTVYAR
jgi:RNA-binding protein